MKWKNSADRYGAGAQLLHWIMAIIMIGMLILGLWMTGLPDGDDKWGWYDLHKSFGMVAWLLILLRIVWRLRNAPPPLPSSMLPWEKWVAAAGHGYLYLAMIALPISGYVDSSAGDFHIDVFGWFNVPLLIAKDKALFDLATTLHWLIAYGLIAVLIGHVGAAFKHHFINRDGVLKRMLPFSR